MEKVKQAHYFPNNYYIVEGFDMVGKTRFLAENLSDYKVYYCNHGLSDETVGRHNSWVIGYGVLDFLSQICPEDRIVINRGVASSYVYKRLYDGHYLDQRILDYYKNNEFFCRKVGHLWIRHHSADTAEQIYGFSQSREKNPNELSAQFDRFNSFSDYWVYYKRAEALFLEVYDKLGIKPRVFETYPDLTWEEVGLLK